MPNSEKFYRCNLRQLVKVYLDCQSWLSIVKDAQLDEVAWKEKEPFCYGVDFCDLMPFVEGKGTESIYQVSRRDMLACLANADFGRSKLLVPPATMLEYVQSVVRDSSKLRRYLQLLDELRRVESPEEFRQKIMPAYAVVRQVMDRGAGNSGLEQLLKMIVDETLMTVESAIASPALRKQIARYPCSLHPRGYELLLERRAYREDNEFSSLIDMSNWELFIATNHVMGSEGQHYLMTTTGNLTLEAFRLSSPELNRGELPCRNLATPYLRQMLRRDEPAHSARLSKIQVAILILEDILAETLKTDEAKAALNGMVDSVSGQAEVWVSKRLYDNMRAWLDLTYFPYLKGLKEGLAQDAPPKDGDISGIFDWTRANIDKLQDRATGVTAKTRRTILEVGGLTDDDIVERFVPRHPEAERILRWLKGD